MATTVLPTCEKNIRNSTEVEATNMQDTTVIRLPRHAKTCLVSSSTKRQIWSEHDTCFVSFFQV